MDLTEQVLRRLETDRNAWLCTLRRDGSPHVTPVWFWYADDTWWIGISENSAKGRNVRRDPRVSLVLEDGAAPVVAEGKATVHTSGFPQRVVDAIARKYGGWDVTAPEPRDGAGGRLLLEVPVERWLLAGAAQ